MKKCDKTFIVLILLGLIVVPVFALEGEKFTFERETQGAESKSFSAIVGTWHIDKDDSNIVYAVDGRKGTSGLSSGAREHAKELYGGTSGEFLKGIEPMKDFPLSICKEVPGFKNGILSVAVKAISGREDQAAGIAFNIKQNGEYLAVRANALENNLVLFKFEKGKRSSLQWVDNVPPPAGGWHTLKVIINGMKIEGYLDDKKYIDYTYKDPVNGRIGLWSKADSYVFFNNVMVQEK